MKSKLLGVLAFMFVPALSGHILAGERDPYASRPPPDPLQLNADAVFDQHKSGNILFVRIKNRSNQFACIYERQFDAVHAQLWFWDPKGELHTSSIAGLPSLSDFKGFNFASSMLMLPPDQYLEMSIDVAPYSLRPDEYKFSYWIFYRPCAAILDLTDRPKTYRSGESAFRVRGRISVPRAMIWLPKGH